MNAAQRIWPYSNLNGNWKSIVVVATLIGPNIGWNIHAESIDLLPIQIIQRSNIAIQNAAGIKKLKKGIVGN
jgi:hypothetical protein